jgi:hypothetical protein
VNITCPWASQGLSWDSACLWALNCVPPNKGANVCSSLSLWPPIHSLQDQPRPNWNHALATYAQTFHFPQVGREPATFQYPIDFKTFTRCDEPGCIFRRLVMCYPDSHKCSHCHVTVFTHFWRHSLDMSLAKYHAQAAISKHICLSS